MKNNFGEIPKRVVIYCLCGAILTPTLTGFICQNPECPEYMLEKHEHLSEKGDTGVAYWVQPDFSLGTPASGVSGTYGPVNFISWPPKGGDSNV